MKRRIVTGCLLILLLVSLLMPYFSLYPHSALDPAVAAAFPGNVSGLDLMLRGNANLPAGLMPALKSVDFREGLLWLGLALTILGAALTWIKRKWFAHISALVSVGGALTLMLFSFYIQQLDQSILFSVMISVKWYLWLTFVVSAALCVLACLALRSAEPLPLGDIGWRRASAALSLAALLMLMLPFVQSAPPQGTFPTAAEDALATRTVYGWQWIFEREPLLSELGASQGQFASPLSGGALQSLTTLSDSASDVRNLFMIPNHNGSTHWLGVAAVAMLGLGLILQLIRKVDRWFPAALLTLGAVTLASEVLGMFTVDSTYQFAGAAYQMMYLGLGGYTLAPLLTMTVTAGAAISAVMGIRRADSPYFVNPVPPNHRLRTVSLFLAACAVVLMLVPVVQFNLYTPGKINQSNPTVARPLSGAELIAFQKPNELLNPVNNRGKLLYGEKAAKNGLTLTDLDTTVSGALTKTSLMTVAAFAATAAGLALLAFGSRNKRLVIAVLLAAAVLQALLAIMVSSVLPRDVGFASGTIPLFAAMGISVFAAFFAGFMDMAQMPKKYRLFLMLLPFLVAVFLFAYLPLSGWRYAFYNYKLGLPMDQQEYVGLKWFSSLFDNPAQTGETVRVLRNTFAMSGLGLITSWMPLAFAIFLTEIRVGWFKKFVQVFTTLPNFISWVLVYSFALAIFSLDTGVVNKALVGLGLIDKPVAWLNSGDHIWLKMWLWNTWKTLGWGAIMYLAAIAGIDQELYEAAKVDGAGRWRQILHITIPGVLPTFFVLLLLAISNVVNNGMEQYLVFQNAMNKNFIEVLDLYVFNISLGTRSTNTISMATAIGILKSLVSIVLLFLANKMSKAVRGESIV